MTGASARAVWASRVPRERVMLLIGGTVLVGLLTYWLVVEPLLAAGQQAARALPELRQQSLALHALAEQAKRLRGQAGGAPASASVASLAASAASAGFSPRITDQGEGGFAVLAEGVALNTMRTWLIEVQTGYRLHVRGARLQSAGDGRVNAQLVLGP